MSAGTRHPAQRDEHASGRPTTRCTSCRCGCCRTPGGIEPGYEQLDINAELAQGGLVPVASGMPRHAGDSAIRIAQRDAALFAARLAAGESVALPAAPYVHLYVARGSVELEGAGTLATGDAVRLTASDGPRVTAAGGPAEVLVVGDARHPRLKAPSTPHVIMRKRALPPGRVCA